MTGDQISIRTPGEDSTIRCAVVDAYQSTLRLFIATLGGADAGRTDRAYCDESAYDQDRYAGGLLGEPSGYYLDGRSDVDEF
jgi:hypothetical protein